VDFQTIKDDGAQVQLKWDTKEGTDTISHELKCFDRPHPDFVAALKGLVPHVLKLLELPELYRQDFRVRGLSISRQGDDWGVVITCLKDLPDTASPLVLNTPYLPEQPTSEGGPCMSVDLADAIGDLEREARAYVKGKREQSDMFEAA
jgi:hypothetical protein